jgi:N-acetylmuramoyl-L-alanine amidase
MNILGKTKVTYAQLETWVKSVKTASPLLLKNLPIIWRLANDRGILVEVFIAQICVETGYFKFGGVIDASFHNTCGLKTTKGGGDYVANAHMRFNTWEEGLTAHADHLALYAGAPGFPKYSPNTKGHENINYKNNGTTKDPRHFTYLYGKCKTVEGLSGTWATNKNYATTIKGIVNKIYATKVGGNDVKTEQPKTETKVEQPKHKYANGSYNRKARVTASSLRVRRGRPGTPGYNTIQGSYKKGQIISVHYCLNGWFGVTYKGKQCFVSGEYLELL